MSVKSIRTKLLQETGTKPSLSIYTFIIHMEMSDIIFEQHMKSYMTLNIVIIVVQFILLFMALILEAIFNTQYIIRLMAGINISLCALVACNNYIHNKTWEKAKERLSEDIVPLLNEIKDYEKGDEE